MKISYRLHFKHFHYPNLWSTRTQQVNHKLTLRTDSNMIIDSSILKSNWHLFDIETVLPILAKLAISTHKQITKGSSTRSKSKTTNGYLSVLVSFFFPSPAVTHSHWLKNIHVHKHKFNKENLFWGGFPTVSM